MITESTLAAIVAAGEQATPRPWRQDKSTPNLIWDEQKKNLPVALTEFDSVKDATLNANYIVLAANNGLEMAQEIQRLRAHPVYKLDTETGEVSIIADADLPDAAVEMERAFQEAKKDPIVRERI